MKLLVALALFGVCWELAGWLKTRWCRPEPAQAVDIEGKPFPSIDAVPEGLGAPILRREHSPLVPDAALPEWVLLALAEIRLEQEQQP